MSERPVVQLGQLALGLPCGAAAVLSLSAACCSFALHYFLFSVPSEKLVVQDLGKRSHEKNIPKLLYSVLRQLIIGIVRLLTLLLPAVCYCGMNFGFEAGWPFVPVKSSMVIRTKIFWKTDFFWCMVKTKAENKNLV